MNRGTYYLAHWLLLAFTAGGLLLGLHATSAQALAPLPQIGQTRVSVTTIQLPIVPLDHALTRLTNPTYNIPYTRLNWGQIDTSRTELRTYTLVVLENNYLRLTLLPELGGRLYQAIFKPTGHNLFYQNPVIKPSPWGPPEMGYWWAIGGIEWGLPVEEHGYEWGTPWAYSISQLPDGVAVTMRDSAAADRLQTAVTITLPNNTAYFEISPALRNPTAHAVDFKFWLNAMLAPGAANKVGPNLRFILPADRVTVHSADDSRLPADWQPAGWPTHNGIDYSRLGNWQGWYGFFQYPQAAGDFQAVYDEAANEGIVRTYPAETVRGAKFFGFGNGSRALPPNLYTNDDSSYVELHGGLAPTFADTRRLEAGQSVAWSERWYPVAALGSLTWANRDVALHLESSGDATRLHLAAAQRRDNVRVVVAERATNRLLFQADGLLLDPASPYHSPAMTLPGLSKDKLAVLVYADDSLLAAFQHSGPPPLQGTPTPTPSPTATATHTPTATPGGSWAGRVRTTLPIAGWAAVARIWVAGKFRTPVTITALNWNWQATSYTGTKLEYGSDALEFAPLAPGNYRVTAPEIKAQFDFALKPAHLTEIVFEPLAAPSPTGTASATPTATATGTASPLPTFTATATATQPPTVTGTPAAITTDTPTANPTATAAATVTPIPSATPTQLPTATDTPSPTPTELPPATDTPAPTATPGWRARVVSNQRVSSNWFAVVRASVEGKLNWPVRITIVTNGTAGWSTICMSGSKPEYGRYTCEFSPLMPGTYHVAAIGTDAAATVQVASGYVAVVAFEKH